MKFLLVVPRYAPQGFSYPFPFGIAYISSALKAAGHEVRCLNLNHEPGEPAEAVAGAMRAFDPDVCGTGGISAMFGLVKTIFETARKAKPDVVNVVGGGLISSAPELAAKKLDIDFGVLGEGEITVVELADALENGGDASRVPGLIIRKPDNGLHRTLDRPPIRDLDSLPLPDYEALRFDKLLDTMNSADVPIYNLVDRPRALSLIASRSCPYRCTFCFHPTGPTYRERSLDSVFAELDGLVEKYDINVLTMSDELFTAKRSRMIEFCERIKPYGLFWDLSIHVSLVDDALLKIMRDAGCGQVGYGLESANEDVLRSMRKKATRPQIESALKDTYENKMMISGNFIFGDTAETMRTANDTMDWWSRNMEYRINLSFLSIFELVAEWSGIVGIRARDG